MSSRHRDEERDYTRPRGDDRRERDRGERRDDRGRRDDDRDRRGDRERDRRNEDYHERRERERERERARERERDDAHRDRDPRFDPRAHQERERDAAREGGRGAVPPPPPPRSSEADRQEAAEEAARLKQKKVAEDQEYKKRVEEQVQELEMNEEEREQKLIEERRRRRAEIAAKFKHQQEASAPEAMAQSKVGMPSAHEPAAAPASVAPPGTVPGALASGPPLIYNNGSAPATAPLSAPSALPTTVSPGETEAPEPMETDSDATGAAASGRALGGGGECGGGGGGRGKGDSDDDIAEEPKLELTAGMPLSVEQRKKEDELRAYLLEHRRRMEGGKDADAATAKAVTAAPAAAAVADAAEGAPTGRDAKGDAKRDEGGDDDGFDMFNDEVEAPEGLAEEAVDEAAMMDRGDNYDDKEGYYAHRIGDVLSERYKVISSAGKGVFSTVVRCVDMHAAPGEPTEVCVKVQRNNDMMRRAGEKEIGYLVSLASNDVDNRRHCIRYLGRFDHEDHLCMVFEAMHQNLRQALKQHGHKRGIHVDAVRAYARQLFTALRFMERLNIVHADLKPDNILVNDKYNMLKVCDFGSATSADDSEITPYLVSRFYRAPEIMMGLHYGCPIDTWAAGVTLYELYTGRIMFQGNSNNMMLKLIQDIKGKMPHKLIRKGFFSELHFDQDNDFLYRERDKVTGREVIRLIKFEQKPTQGKDLRTLLMPNKAAVDPSEGKKAFMLADLLEKALILDPSKRLTPSQALKHPFCDLNRKI